MSNLPTSSRLLLVLLRIAIGWHLLYEGMVKWESLSTPSPWSSRVYLENAEGPLADYFHALADTLPQDVFDEEVIVERWRAHLGRFAEYHQLDQDQRTIA